MCAKYNNINRLKKRKREEWKQALVQEIAEHKGEVKDLKGFVVIDSAADEQESISSLHILRDKGGHERFLQPWQQDSRLLSRES
jgi:hypothetical protein